MKAIVIGGGAGGLAVANLLAKQGYEVELFEKNSQLGGRMGCLKRDGFTFDTGPSWYLMPEVFDHYFSLLGRRTADYYKLQKLKPAYKVFFDYATPVVVQGDVRADAALFESIEKGAGLRIERYVQQSKQIYQLALDYFLYNPFRSVRSLIALPIVQNSQKLFSGLFLPLHQFVAKQFHNKQLQQILEYSMVFLGTSPFSAPSLYRLMSYLDFEQGVFFPKRGMIKVTEALVAMGKELGVTYKIGESVDEIIVKQGKAVGVRIGGKEHLADIVVSNADLAFTETKLLHNKYQTYPSKYWEKRKPAPSALLLYIGVKGSLPELKHHNLLFIKDWKKNFADIYAAKDWPQKASMYVSRTSATDPNVAPKGHENIFILVPLPAGMKMNKQTEKKLVDRYLAQLEQMTGLHDFRKRIASLEVRGPSYFANDYNAWQNSALGLNHQLRQSAFMRPSVRSKKVKNLYYVGGMTQPGIGIPMCLISAELVIKSLINDKSPGPLSGELEQL